MALDQNFMSEEDMQESAEAITEVGQHLLQQNQLQTEAQDFTEQYETTQADARDNPEGWGIQGLAKEAQSILSGGLQDTASSIATLPERTADMLSGEMAEERKTTGKYTPEWDPFKSYSDPIETRTWWGQLLRGVVHFGSLSLIPIAGWKSIAGKAAYYGTNSLIRAAAIGAGADLISQQSDGDNALAMLRDRYGWMDTPLTTKDTDHPMMLKLKNVVEGMGIGLIFDGAAMALSGGSSAVKGKIIRRTDSIKNQTEAKALQELQANEFGKRGAKNKPIVDQHQAAYQSEIEPYEAKQALKRTREEWGAEDGGAGSVTTPIERERTARTGVMSEETAERLLRGLKSSAAYQAEVEAIKAGQKTIAEVWGDSLTAHQRITLGRNAAEMSPEEYLEEILRGRARYDVVDADNVVIDTIETILPKNVGVTDLVVGTLLKQLRDTGISGREIAEHYNLGAIDGPADQIFDTMMTALTEAKRARMVASDQFRQFGAGKQAEAKAFLDEVVKADMKDTRESIMSILQIAKDEPDDELLNALFEVFSSMKTVNSLDDFDAWCRKIIKGGQLEPKGPNRTGALIRQLQEMFSHSVLSGPKTPMRAIMGTSTATFLRPLSQTLGGLMRYPFSGDATTIRTGLASMNAMMQAVPESLDLFFNRLNSYWAGDVSSMKTRFVDMTEGDANWEILRRFYESDRATPGDKVTFAFANMVRNANDSNLLNYSTKIMAATDDAFAFLLGRAKMREKALISAMDAQAKGIIPDFDGNLLRKFEDDFYAEVFDKDGNIKDEATKFARKEVTLTQDLSGFSKGLNDVFTSNPWARPFFLFARTGVNGLSLTAKHTPGFNFLVKEFNDIAFASVDNLAGLEKYGITTAQDLLNAKALQTGRLGIGTSLVAMASWSWMSGNITGNGPTDRSQRQMWKDSGWLPRSIKLGDVWISYDAIEPFNQIFALICDIGDNSLLMGEEWTKDQLQKTAIVMMQGISSKSYMAGMQQFTDLIAGKPGQAERIIAGIANNQVPLAGLRNELGKLFTPYTRELSSGIGESIRNRNLVTENLAGEPLPIKYDMLTGRPIKDHDFMTRAFNMFSPVHFNLDHGEGKQFLFKSGYDLRVATYYAPDGTDLTDHPEIRSRYQQLIGEQNLELQLARLAKSPKVQASLEQMMFDIRSGLRGDYQTRDYYHNIMIEKLFYDARKIAWTKLEDEDNVLQVRLKQLESLKLRKSKEASTTIQPLLNMYK